MSVRPYTTMNHNDKTQSRNMTGIYLGLEGNSNPPRSRSAIPPLAKARTSFRLRTPVEQQRFRRVEELRIKEEKRGFTGLPVRRCQKATTLTYATPQHNQFYPVPLPRQSSWVQTTTSDTRRWGPGKRLNPNNWDQLLRPNLRNYVTVSNSGVTRSEKLTSQLLTPSAEESVLTQDSTLSADDLSELEECFRKVCKGDVSMLYSLLPDHHPPLLSNQQPPLGFTVRSYRNPNQAKILAEFCPSGKASGRCKTSRPLPSADRHLYAATKFDFQPSTSHGSSWTTQQPQRQPEIGSNCLVNTPAVQPWAVTGPSSRALQTTYIQSSTIPPPSGLVPDTTAKSSDQSSSGQFADSRDCKLRTNREKGPYAQRTVHRTSVKLDCQENDRVTNTSLPADERTSSAFADESTSESKEEMETVTWEPVAQVQVVAEENSAWDVGDQRPRPKLTASNSGADIMLGLETEEGQSAEVEIDSADQDELMPEAEAPKGRVRKASITDKVIKSKASEALAAIIKEEAESRQREFEKLLDEHAELVQEISRTPSSENLVQGERDH